MVFEYKFPDLGEGIQEGELLEWKVEVGDKVEEHDVIAEVETDKAVADVPSPKSGTIKELKFEPGDMIQVGDVIALIDTGEEGAEEAVEEEAEEETEGAPEEEETKEGEQEKEAKEEEYKCPECDKTFVSEEQKEAHMEERHEDEGPGTRAVGELEEAPEEIEAPEEEEREEEKKERAPKTHVMATPAVRGLAKELNVDIHQIEGTGKDGRVTAEDVERAAEEAHEEGAEEKKRKKDGKEPEVTEDKYGKVRRVPMSATRKAIAEHMKKSVYTAPHVVAMNDADVTELWDIREEKKELAREKGFNLTYMPFIIKACLAALKEHPYFNASLDEENEEFVLKKYYNIGIAAHTEDGLKVPVVKNVDEKSIMEMAEEIEDLAARARDRSIGIEEMKGHTFTITNWGSIGGHYGVPAINYPDVAILGVGRIEEKPVVRDGEIVKRKILPLSLSFDHRAVDGAQAAYFMEDLIAHLEDPDLLLIDE